MTRAPISRIRSLAGPLLLGWVLAGAWIGLSQPSREDMLIYLGAWEELRRTGDLYSFQNANGGGFTYPPFALAMIVPLLQLGAWSVHLWDAASLLALTIGVLAVWRWSEGRPHAPAPDPVQLARIDTRTPLTFGLLFVLTLASQPVRDSLHFGQLSPFVAALFLAGVAPSLGRFAGCLTGVAAAVKLTPATVWLLWLARRRSWPALFASLATFLGCALAAYLLLPGPSREYWTSTVLATGRVGDVASLGNNSLWGISERLGAGQAGAVVLCGLAVLLLIVWVRQGSADPPRILMVAYLASLLLAPISWTHHGVLVVPVLLTLTASAAHRVVVVCGTLSMISWMLPMYAMAKAAEGLSAPAAATVAAARPVLLVAFLAALLLVGDHPPRLQPQS